MNISYLLILLLFILPTTIGNMGKLVTKKKSQAPPPPRYVRGPGGRDQAKSIMLSTLSTLSSVPATFVTPSPTLKRRRVTASGKAKRARISATEKIREMGTEIGTITANTMTTDSPLLHWPPSLQRLFRLHYH